MKGKFRKTMLLSGACAILFLAFFNTPLVFPSYASNGPYFNHSTTNTVSITGVSLSKGSLVIIGLSGLCVGCTSIGSPTVTDSLSNNWGKVTGSDVAYTNGINYWDYAVWFYAVIANSGTAYINGTVSNSITTAMWIYEIQNTSDCCGTSTNSGLGSAPVITMELPSSTIMNSLTLSHGNYIALGGSTTATGYTAGSSFTIYGSFLYCTPTGSCGYAGEYASPSPTPSFVPLYVNATGANNFQWAYSVLTINGIFLPVVITTTLTAFNTPSVTDANWIVVTFILLIFWGGASTLLIEMKRTKNILFVSLFTLVIGSIAGVLAGFNGNGIVSFAIPVFYGIPLFLYFMRNRGNDSST